MVFLLVELVDGGGLVLVSIVTAMVGMLRVF